MTICREWMLQRQSPTHAEAKPLLCRSWNCDHCQPLRKRQLMAQAAAGDPNRFVTLTVNPSHLDNPAARLEALAWAWRTVVKRLRREHKGKPIEYLVVVEETKAGEPHLHILLRSPFIPHHQLSQYMAELINAPIVDIRSVRGSRHVVNYVAKYIAKKPAQFGSSKRYWQSRNYQLEDDYEQDETAAQFSPWAAFHQDERLLLLYWSMSGYELTERIEDKLYAEWRPPHKGDP